MNGTDKSIPARMQALVLDLYEGIDGLRLVEKETPRPGPGEVLVRMSASPVNPSDLSFLRGQYGVSKELPVVPGFEGSGVVVAGEGRLARLLQGRRVACVVQREGDGTWAEYARVPAQKCMPLLGEVSQEQGATLIVNPFTAWALVELARNGGHKALMQTAAASALGRMILRLGRRFGLDIIHVVRRPAQVALLQEEGARHVLNSSDPDFDDRLRALCYELDVHLAIDAVAGEMSGRLLDAMPRQSRVVVYGGLSEANVQVTPGALIFGAKRVDGFWLSPWLAGKRMPDLLWTSYRVQKALAGPLQTIIQGRYPLDEAIKGLRRYEANMTAGKILITPPTS